MWRRASTDTSTSSGSGNSVGTTTASEAAASTTTSTKHNFSAVMPPPTFEQFLVQIVILGVIMIYFYLCDYRKVGVLRCCVGWMFFSRFLLWSG